MDRELLNNITNYSKRWNSYFLQVLKINIIANRTYITLCCQIGLHGHGMFDHQLGPDLAEQVQGGDTCHQPCWVHTFAFYNENKNIFQNKYNSAKILSQTRCLFELNLFKVTVINIVMLPARDSSYFRMCSTRLSTSWTQAFLAGLYDASSSDFKS